MNKYNIEQTNQYDTDAFNPIYCEDENWQEIDKDRQENEERIRREEQKENESIPSKVGEGIAGVISKIIHGK